MIVREYIKKTICDTSSKLATPNLAISIERTAEIKLFTETIKLKFCKTVKCYVKYTSKFFKKILIIKIEEKSPPSKMYIFMHKIYIFSSYGFLKKINSNFFKLLKKDVKMSSYYNQLNFYSNKKNRNSNTISI